jgi:hypothetical protein
MEDQFYLQDSRQCVGNDILWWAINGAGYTCDIRKAHVFTREEAVSHHKSRRSDIPWPKSYIDGKTRPVVDMQNVKIEDAIKGHKIRILKEKRERYKMGKTRGNCPVCGKITWDYNPYENAYCKDHDNKWDRL